MNPKKPGAQDTASPAAIMDTARAFQQSRILLTAYELDIFTILGERDKSSGDVADAIGTAHRATDRLMNALCALGLLEKKDGRFSNSPGASRFLVKGKPDYLAGLMHAVHLWDTWSTLTDAVRRGTSVVVERLEDRDEDWQVAFIAAMHQFARQRAPDVVAMLDLHGVSRVLDIGGGSGAYSMAFVRAKENVTATVFDLPTVAPLTRQYVEAEGLLDGVEIVTGDYNVDEFGSGFDMAFLSAIIHANSFEENQRLIQKAARALNPGGQVVVQDFIVDEDRTSPPSAAFFALNMLVGTRAGDAYAESEVRGWMTEAGLSEIIRKETDINTTLIIGRKHQ